MIEMKILEFQNVKILKMGDEKICERSEILPMPKLISKLYEKINNYFYFNSLLQYHGCW